MARISEDDSDFEILANYWMRKGKAILMKDTVEYFMELVTERGKDPRAVLVKYLDGLRKMAPELLKEACILEQMMEDRGLVPEGVEFDSAREAAAKGPTGSNVVQFPNVH